jgi:hypothetical protein
VPYALVKSVMSLLHSKLASIRFLLDFYSRIFFTA